MINKERIKLQKEAIEKLKENGYNGFVILPTGSGKAALLIQVLKILKPKTVWYLCDSELNRDVTFKKELEIWGAKSYIDKIDFMCYQTAYKLKDYEVDLVLADEADFSLTPEYMKVYLNNTIKNKVLVSGTLETKKRKLLKKIVPIVYEKDLEDIKGKGIVNDSKYYIVNYLLNTKENFAYLNYNSKFASVLNNKPVNMEKLEQITILRKLFLSKLETSMETCKKLLSILYKQEDRKILIFCGTSEEADRVCKYSYHSKNNNIKVYEDFDAGIIRIMSVVGKVNRGINIKGVNTAVFKSPSASNTKWQQQSGRTRRLDIGDYSDIFFLIPHYKDRFGRIKPTVVERWVYESLGNLKVKPEIFKLI